ncbi:MAG: glycosyltransferase family 2 protein [Burkholderiales bacterium]
MQLSIVVPVRNEQDNILPLLEEIHAALSGQAEFEVIYVNDGSMDATPARLGEAMTRYPRLRVMAHRSSAGQSAALMTGFRAARGEWIATLDGDGQNDPADIPKLIAARDAARDGVQAAKLQLVAGYRRKRQDSWLKRVSSRVANGVRSRLLGDATPDTGCGLKLIQRAAVLELPFFDHMHRFLPALVQRNGGATISVEVNHRSRSRGVSNYGLFDRLWVGIVDLFGVMWLQRRSRRPEASEVRRP